MKVHLWVLACALSSAAWAGDVARRANPADPTQGGAKIAFDSGLAPAKSEPSVDPTAHWREHNDRVRETGGHVGLFRPSRASTPKPPAAPAHGSHR